MPTSILGAPFTFEAVLFAARLAPQATQDGCTCFGHYCYLYFAPQRITVRANVLCGSYVFPMLFDLFQTVNCLLLEECAPSVIREQTHCSVALDE